MSLLRSFCSFFSVLETDILHISLYIIKPQEALYDWRSPDWRWMKSRIDFRVISWAWSKGVFYGWEEYVSVWVAKEADFVKEYYFHAFRSILVTLSSPFSAGSIEFVMKAMHSQCKILIRFARYSANTGLSCKMKTCPIILMTFKCLPLYLCLWKTCLQLPERDS